MGLGHASPIVAGDRVWQFSRIDGREGLTALRLSDGEQLWRVDHDVPFTMNRGASPHGKGPKSTPALADGRIFTLGIAGTLAAHDAETGNLLWRHDFRDEFTATHPKFGTGMSPIVVGDKVVAHVGTEDDGALFAFDVATGKRVWAMEEDGPAFASPMLVRIDGVRQLVTQTRSRILSVDPDDGSILWGTPFTTRFDQNIVTPLAVGERLIFSGLDHGVFALEPRLGADGWEVREVWRNRDASMYMSSPVLADGKLFGMSHRRAGQFFALDPEDGSLLWTSRGRDADHAGLLVVGHHVLFLTAAAELIVVPANSNAYAPVARVDLAPSPTWAYPVPTAAGLLIKDKEHLALWTVGDDGSP